MEAAKDRPELHAVIVDVDETTGTRARHAPPRDQRRLSRWTPPARFRILTAFYIQEIGALLFGLVFLFLYRQSRVVYFGLWAIAWVLRFLAAIFGFELLRTMHIGLAGALRHVRVRIRDRADFGGARGLRLGHEGLAHGAAPDRDPADFRGAGVGDRAVGGHRGVPRSHAIVLGFVYLYNFLMLRQQQGIGSRFFRFSLLVLAVMFVEHAAILAYFYRHGAAPEWARYLHYESYSDFVLHCVLAFSAMAMWSESQIDRLRELAAELDSSAPRARADIRPRSPDRAAQPGGAGAARGGRRRDSTAWWRSATWTISRTSTTATATWSATRSCAISGTCCKRRSATPTRRSAGAATSS